MVFWLLYITPPLEGSSGALAVISLLRWRAVVVRSLLYITPPLEGSSCALAVIFHSAAGGQ